MRRLVVAVATTVALLLAMPMSAAAHEGLCPGEVFGAFHAGLATEGGIPAHNPGAHFGFAGVCLHDLVPLPGHSP